MRNVRGRGIEEDFARDLAVCDVAADLASQRLLLVGHPAALLILEARNALQAMGQ